MSALGDQYEFDVFFSYAWARDTDDTKLRDWSRKIADTITTLLKQRFNGSGTKFQVYLDRDLTKSAQDIDRELESATKRSAILVSMVSNYYDTDYCRKEVDWFCDKLAADGGAIADHVCILRIQDVAQGRWPKRLSAPDGKPLVYLDFCDEIGQPIDMARFATASRKQTPGGSGQKGRAGYRRQDRGVEEVAGGARGIQSFAAPARPPAPVLRGREPG